MKPETLLQALRGCLLTAIFLVSFTPEVRAHGDTNWNEYTIEKVNKEVTSDIQRVQSLVAHVVLSQKEPDAWPTPEMRQLETELKELQEEVDDMINHLTQDGIDIQSRAQLVADPRAGRGVAAGDALQTCIDLLDHAASLAGRKELAQELDTDGLAAYMYDLLDAQSLNMELYGRLNKP